MSKKEKNSLYQWLTTPYELILREESDFSEKKNYKVTYGYMILFGGIIATTIFAISLVFAKTILAQWFDPAYAENNLRTEVTKLFYKVDSLEIEAQRKDNYIQAIQIVLNGGETIEEDSSQTTTKTEVDPQKLENIAPIDSQIRREVEEEYEHHNSVHLKQDESALSNMLLFPPVNAFDISQSFNAQEGHYGIDVIAKENSPIQSISEGTVVMADWTHDMGYIIAIQHENNIISIYKHNSVLLKKVGNFVTAGDVIAIIGDSGELSTGPHLHFELWYKGNPVNPEHFISFK
ncbi:MAG: M23 family metallopeptidase [Cytophagales bacterium]|nr:M23 family metallopeptidase [Cytophagales bacterium]